MVGVEVVDSVARVRIGMAWEGRRLAQRARGREARSRAIVRCNAGRCNGCLGPRCWP